MNVDADALANLSNEQLQFMEQNIDQFANIDASAEEGSTKKTMKD